MDRRSRVFSVMLLCAALVFSGMTGLTGHADGERIAALAAADAEDEKGVKIEFGKCRAAAVYECSTGTLLAGCNENDSLPAGHLAKLMTFLIAAEKISAGDLCENDTAVCSHYANSQQDPQIWLDAGEKISVSELLKSISIGNANDASVCLAEKISQSTNDFTALMNRKAEMLDMRSTYFADVSGTLADTVISAADACKLCSELVKYDDFAPYFTTWMDSVRSGKAELVSRNRMMRVYKGIRGFKVCHTPGLGECAAVCARRGDMTVCAVVLGTEDEDQLFVQVRKLLDSAFSAFEVYHPELPEGTMDDIRIEHGEKQKCRTEIPGLVSVIIPKGSYRDITVGFERLDKLSAPVKKGATVGRIIFKINESELISAEICTAESVEKAGYGFSLKRILLNMLNI